MAGWGQTSTLMGPRSSYSSRKGTSARSYGISGLGFPRLRSGSSRRGGGGGGPATIGPSGGGGPSTAQLNIPAHQPYQPQQYNDPNLGYMAEQARGLMDPNSDYYKRLSAGMQRQIGQQSAAQERGAALRGAWGGLGAGASPELLATQADISQAGLEAQGQAEAGLRLAAPQLGMQGLQSTFQPQLGYHQLGEGSRQFGAGMGEQARQFGAGLGLQQQQMAAQAAQQQAQMQQQMAMFNAQAQNQFSMADRQRQHELMMQQMSGLYG